MLPLPAISGLQPDNKQLFSVGIQVSIGKDKNKKNKNLGIVKEISNMMLNTITDLKEPGAMMVGVGKEEMMDGEDKVGIMDGERKDEIMFIS